MSASPVFELRGVKIRAGETQHTVVHGVDWTVTAGDFWVVAGAHGSGKSALLATLGGLLPAVEGELSILGEPLGTNLQRRAGWRRGVGLVFENGGRPIRGLTVAENIALPLCYHDDLAPSAALEHVAPLIAALGLERLAETSSGRIGRAWAQRAALARALAPAPEVVLLDNPLAGLDPFHLQWWREFLPKLNRGHPVCGDRPITLVVTTDDVEPWHNLARQFAQVAEGRWQILNPTAPLQAN